MTPSNQVVIASTVCLSPVAEDGACFVFCLLFLIFQCDIVMDKQGSSTSSESSPSREVSPLEGIIDDMQTRIKRLERWHTINTVNSKTC